jgi:hypothetical protein
MQQTTIYKHHVNCRMASRMLLSWSSAGVSSDKPCLPPHTTVCMLIPGNLVDVITHKHPPHATRNRWFVDTVSGMLGAFLNRVSVKPGRMQNFKINRNYWIKKFSANWLIILKKQERLACPHEGSGIMGLLLELTYFFITDSWYPTWSE